MAVSTLGNKVWPGRLFGSNGLFGPLPGDFRGLLCGWVPLLIQSAGATSFHHGFKLWPPVGELIIFVSDTLLQYVSIAPKR